VFAVFYTDGYLAGTSPVGGPILDAVPSAERGWFVAVPEDPRSGGLALGRVSAAGQWLWRTPIGPVLSLPPNPSGYNFAPLRTNDWGHALAPLGGGGGVVAYVMGDLDSALVALDAAGRGQWHRPAYWTERPWTGGGARELLGLPDGFVVINPGSGCADPGMIISGVVRFDSAGNNRGVRCLGSAGMALHRYASNRFGDVAAVGCLDKPTSIDGIALAPRGGPAAFIVVLDSSGRARWAHLLGRDDGGACFVTVAVDSRDRWVVGGTVWVGQRIPGDLTPLPFRILVASFAR